MTITLPDRLVVDDLTFAVEHRPQRKTLGITVERDASLTIAAPTAVTVAQIETFVEAKKDWIYRKLAQKDALIAPPVTKQFINGEGFRYLGRSHRLLLCDSQDVDVKLAGGRFQMATSVAGRGSEAMRRWYTKTGHGWLSKRIEPWAQRMSVNHPKVRVLDLGFRWGSAKDNSINIHWATLQLPPSLIDYVLVHELAHIQEPNHTPGFWAMVDRAMPGYETRRDRLTIVGREVWLGATTSRKQTVTRAKVIHGG